MGKILEKIKDKKNIPFIIYGFLLPLMLYAIESIAYIFFNEEGIFFGIMPFIFCVIQIVILIRFNNVQNICYIVSNTISSIITLTFTFCGMTSFLQTLVFNVTFSPFQGIGHFLWTFTMPIIFLSFNVIVCVIYGTIEIIKKCAHKYKK